MRLGIIFKDHSGQVPACATKNYQSCFQPKLAKAIRNVMGNHDGFPNSHGKPGGKTSQEKEAISIEQLMNVKLSVLCTYFGLFVGQYGSTQLTQVKLAFSLDEMYLSNLMYSFRPMLKFNNIQFILQKTEGSKQTEL